MFLSNRSVGDRFNMAKSTLWYCFERVVISLNVIAPQVIEWPSKEQIPFVKEHFRKIAGLENVIGAIDGTYIPIKAPKEYPEVYITRKCNYAMTLQAVCTSNLMYTDCYIGFPGSVNDRRIFENSDLYLDIQSDPRKYFPNDEMIIGDKAYPTLEWCMEPYIDRGKLTPSQKKFNHILSQTRQTVERSFALLFGRWRRLKFLDMNRTDLVPATVMACCVLHNFCIISKDQDDFDQYIKEGYEYVLGTEDGDDNTCVESRRTGEEKRSYITNVLNGTGTKKNNNKNK